MEDVAIQVRGVSKDFVLPHEKITTVKGAFTGMVRKKTSTGKTTTQHALRNISFEVKKGEFFGIVGRNGSGKSTLLKILAGIYQPTSGSVVTHGKLVPFIELGVGFNPELTGRENVYLNGAMLGFSQKEIDAMYDNIVSFAELEQFMDQKLKNYSSGMQVRLAFSMATRAEADILLVDEVLAVGDADFQRKCFNYFRKLKKQQKTVVFVSHDMSAIREYCDRAVLIEKSQLALEGEVGAVATAYTRMFMHESEEDAQKDDEKVGRWGDKRVTFESVVPEKRELIGMKPIKIHCQVSLGDRSIDSLVFGFTIKNQAGTEIAGVNSDILRHKINPVKLGVTASIEWTVPNIFNDGTYYVDVAAHGTNGDVYDWWEEATSFTVYKEEKTAYLTMPDIKFTID